MYTGTITVDTSNVRTILHLACSFQLTQLRDHCCTFLQTTMMPSSCLSIKDLAEQFSLTGLTRAAESFLMANITQVTAARESLTQIIFLYCIVAVTFLPIMIERGGGAKLAVLPHKFSKFYILACRIGYSK